MLRAGNPDPAEVIALAKAPMAWTKAKNTLLVQYGLMPRSEWPRWATVSAVQIRDRRGKVLGQWVDDSGGEGDVRSYWPAGRYFVGLPQYGGSAVLVKDGTTTVLSRVRGRREAEPGDIRFGPGMAP